MSKIKVSELSGAALDWAVAKAEGFNVQSHDEWMKVYWTNKGYPENAIEEHLYRGRWVVIETVRDSPQLGKNDGSFERPTPIPTYSTNWAQGGPIIEREGISVGCMRDYGFDGWEAGFNSPHCQGPTALIAAMRFYVADKLGGKFGNEVEIPEELL